MGRFIKAGRVSRYNMRMITENARIIAMAVIVLLFLVQKISPVLLFSRSVDIPVTPYAFVFLVNDSVCQFIIIASAVVIFSNAPFEDEGYPYMLPRAGRFCWASGQILYIVKMTLLYMGLLMSAAVIPFVGNLKFDTEWGKIWGTLAKTDAGSGVGLDFSISDFIVDRYAPVDALLLSLLLEWACILWIGLLIYLGNKITNKSLGTIAGVFFTLLDVCIANDWVDFAYGGSPVSLAQIGTYSGYALKYKIDLAYGIKFFIFGIIILLLLCLYSNYRNIPARLMYQIRKLTAFISREGKMDQNAVVIIQNVTKEFKKQIVLNDINIHFNQGKIYGLIGRNGSGKTVLLKCICGLLVPSAGTVTVNGKVIGKDVDFPENVGFIIENPGFLQNYSGFKNLRYLASIKGKIDDGTIREFIKLVGLDPDDKRAVGKYSLGMRQRLGIAQALMENPDIIILDEPMNALDHIGVDEMREVILKMKEQGKLIIIASHIREDIEVLCDEVYEMKAGALEKM